MKWAIMALLLSSTALAETTNSLTHSTVPNLMTIQSGYYLYEPQADITAQEVAEVLRVLLLVIGCHNTVTSCNPTKSIEAAPANVRRHFTYHEK